MSVRSHPVYRLMDLVGPRSAAFVCGVDSTTVLRVWAGRAGSMPGGVLERVVVVCDVFDFGLEFVERGVLVAWFLGVDDLLPGVGVSPARFARDCVNVRVLRDELFGSVRRLVFE